MAVTTRPRPLPTGIEPPEGVVSSAPYPGWRPPRGRQHGRHVHLHPAGGARQRGRPAWILSHGRHRSGSLLLALVYANLGTRLSAHRRPVPLRTRAFGDSLSASDRLGRTGSAAWVGNAAIAVAFAGYLGVFWGDVTTTNWLAALVAIE